MSYLIPNLQDKLQHAHDTQTCIHCGGDASELDNDISITEYHMSGLCQSCQNDVFNGDEDESL